MECLAKAEGEPRCWAVDVGELGVPKADAAAEGRSMGESIKGVRSHLFLLKKESA